MANRIPAKAASGSIQHQTQATDLRGAKATSTITGKALKLENRQHQARGKMCPGRILCQKAHREILKAGLSVNLKNRVAPKALSVPSPHQLQDNNPGFKDNRRRFKITRPALATQQRQQKALPREVHARALPKPASRTNQAENTRVITATAIDDWKPPNGITDAVC